MKVTAVLSKTSFMNKTYAKRTGLRSMQHISGVEREIIEAYKADLKHEIWGNETKLKNWAAEKFNELANKNYISYKLDIKTTEQDRNSVVREWAYILNHNPDTQNNPFLKLKILKSVTANMTDSNAQAAPIINRTIIADTIYEVKKNGGGFIKLYYKNLKNFNVTNNITLEPISINGIKGDWLNITMPDKAFATRSPGQFSSISNCIAALSQGTNWCTRTPGIVRRDFIGQNIHIFMDIKGNPQLGIFGFDKTKQYKFICGKEQYSPIPDKYKIILEDYIKTHSIEEATLTKDNTKINILELCK